MKFNHNNIKILHIKYVNQLIKTLKLSAGYTKRCNIDKKLSHQINE